MTMKKGLIWHSGAEDVDRWRGVFLEEMRLRGASGQQMGEAWATMEAHCQETGESLTAAFGDPVSYAQSLTGDDRSPWAVIATYGTMFLGFVGLWLTLYLPWTALGEPVSVTWGSLALIPLGIAACGLLWVAARRMRTHKGQGFVLWMVAFMGFQQISQGLDDWRHEAFVSPAWVLWLVTLACLLLCTVGSFFWVRDRMIDPRTGQTPSMMPAFWWWVLAAMPLWGPGAVLFFRWLAHR